MVASTIQRNLHLDDDRCQRAAQGLLAEVPAVSSIAITDASGRTVPVPPELSSILQTVLSAVAAGAGVSVQTLPDELTTGVAAEHLGVSRQAVVKMIERGELPAHKVGSHRRIRRTDVRELKRARRERQREAFAALRDLDDQLDQL